MILQVVQFSGKRIRRVASPFAIGKGEVAKALLSPKKCFKQLRFRIGDASYRVPPTLSSHVCLALGETINKSTAKGR